MRIGISLFALLATPACLLYGQAAPTATAPVSSTPASTAGSHAGFRLPGSDGTIHYEVGASQIVQYGYFGSGNVTSSAAINGGIGYSSLSTKAPFDMMYSGGVLISESSGQDTTTYQGLSLSQGLMAGKWVFGLDDSVSYLPQSPTTGYSGIPGVGDIGVLPPGSPSLGGPGTILTYSGNRVDNTVSGSAERLITGRTSASAVGSYGMLRFLNGNEGFDTSSVSGQAALNHRINGRDTISANAVYSLFTYGKSEGGINFETRGVNGVFTRLLSRTLSLEVSAGPQWVTSSDKALIPNSLSAAASVGLGYAHGLTNAELGYTRGVNGGSGVQLGGLSDTATAGVSHAYGREWLVAVTGSYSHTEALAKSNVLPPAGLTIPFGGTFSTVFGGVQVTHRISRSLSMYGSYTGQNQSYDSKFNGVNAFNGTSHTFGIGITYAPHALRLGQF